MNGWALAAILTWVLWGLQLLALALFALPRAASYWAYQGYELGRRDEKNGVPRAVIVRLPKAGKEKGR